MHYTTLGRSGAVVSRLALGTMTFGATTNEADARDQLDLYREQGGTLIETADIYNAGAAETIIGGWLDDLDSASRSRIFLASKGRFPVGVDPRDAGLSRRHLRRALDWSLTRLGVDHIDLYQLHAWDPLTPIDESIGFLNDAVAAGKISYGGLSNFTGWQIATATGLAAGHFPLVSMQPQYNLLVREVEWEIIPASVNAGLGVLPWSPLGGGWLTGKYAKDARPQPETRLGDNPEGDGMEAWNRRSGLDRTWAVVDSLKSVAEHHNVSPSQIALAWLLDQPAVTSVILGSRSVTQLGENMKSIDVVLTPNDRALLDRVSDPVASDYPYGLPGIEQRTRTLA